MFYRKRKIWSKGKITGVVITTSLITALLFLFGVPYIFRFLPKPNTTKNISYQSENNPQGAPIANSNGSSGGTVVTQVSDRVMPSVVGISALALTHDKIFDSGGAGQWGVGSGVIVSENGYIITNNHVAGGKAKILVTLHDGRVVDGTTLWADPLLDLAVVKIDARGLPTAVLGDNNTLKVGDLAVAIGNPLGLQFQRTVTSGIISGLNRTVSINTNAGTNYMEDLIQTDALINPGNSGGPLINSKGEIVGINTIKITTAEGMGFAIPINIVKPIVNDFIQTGKHTSPHIGIFAYDRNVMNYIDNGINIERGIYVADVDKTGPAGRAGIKVGDIITHVDNIEVNTMLDFRTYIYRKGVGKPVTINYYSNGQPRTATVTLEAVQKADLTR